jgi:hypothetical protein
MRLIGCPRAARGAAICLALLFCVCAFSFGEDKPRVAVLAFENATGNSSYDAVSDAATRTLDLTLRSLGSYDVRLLPRSALEKAGNSARKLARAEDVDTVLYGSVRLEGESLVKASVSIFDWEKDPAKFDTPPVKPVDIFGAVDDLVSAALDSMTGAHIAFGSLEFKNSGQKGDYRVTIDDIDAGPNVESISRWKAGKHRVVVSQKRMLGERALYDADIDVGEEQSAEIGFSIPLLLEEEKAKIAALEARVQAGWDRLTEVDKTELAVSDYAELWTDISYCPALSAYAEKAGKMRADWEKQKLSFGAALATPLPVAPVSKNKIVDPHLFLWYKLDEDKGDLVADSSGHGRDARIVGPASWVSGAKNNAIQLKSGYIEIPADAFSGLGDFTISFWAREGSPPSGGRLFDFGTGPDAYWGLSLSPLDDKERTALLAKAESSVQEALDAGALDYRYWRFVVVSTAAGVATVYVDGKPAGTLKNIAAKLGDLGGVTTNYIGKSHQASSSTFLGCIDDFRVYDRALGQDEIAAFLSSSDKGRIELGALMRERAELTGRLRTRSALNAFGWIFATVAVAGAADASYSYIKGRDSYARYKDAQTPRDADDAREDIEGLWSKLFIAGLASTGGGLSLSTLSFIAGPSKNKVKRRIADIDTRIEELGGDATK